MVDDEMSHIGPGNLETVWQKCVNDIPVLARIGSATQSVSPPVGVTLKELAALLQLLESTLHRLRRQATLAGPTAERIKLLEGVIQHGLRVYGNDESAQHDWLRYPLAELDRRTPLQTLTTIAGFTQVNDVLGRIEHSIFF